MAQESFNSMTKPRWGRLSCKHDNTAIQIHMTDNLIGTLKTGITAYSEGDHSTSFPCLVY